MRPILTLYVPTPVSPATQRRLRVLLWERCGPYQVILCQTEDTSTTHTTYDLSGEWTLSNADIHRHLVDVFKELVTP